MESLQRLFSKKGILIEGEGKRYSVKEILSVGDIEFEHIPKGSLSLLMCKNQFESVFFYINALERGVVPILLDAETNINVLNSLIDEYQPSFIFSPESKCDQFKGYSWFGCFKRYIILKRDRAIHHNLHDDLAVLLSTSGTTGSPKLVRLSYANLLANAKSISDYLQLNKSERAISILPMNYSFGLSIINSHLYSGASIVITDESVTQRRFWEIFRQFKVTSFSGVPYTYEIIRKFKLLEAGLPSIRTLTQAGGKLSLELNEYLLQLAAKKNLNFFAMYGQTEGAARLSYLHPRFSRLKMGSIGKPVPSGVFSIIDDKDNVINECNVSGELVFHGPNVMLGYAEKLKDLSLGDLNNGVLRTGDIAFFDEDGFFYITGRIKRFIKIYGHRISLDELEILLQGLGVSSACIGGDNLLIVYIVHDKNADVVRQYLTQKLGINRRVIDIRVIDEIPKNNAGKTLYNLLKFD